MASPEKLRIPYEPGDAGPFRHMGSLPDGTQFLAFVTAAFPGTYPYRHIRSDWRTRKRWLAVLHRFDADGNYQGSDTQLGGLESEGRSIASGKAAAQLEQMLAALVYELGDIHVRPFFSEIDEIQFTLKYENKVDADGSEWEWVMLWPNDIMFHPPWDSGMYSR